MASLRLDRSQNPLQAPPILKAKVGELADNVKHNASSLWAQNSAHISLFCQPAYTPSGTPNSSLFKNKAGCIDTDEKRASQFHPWFFRRSKRKKPAWSNTWEVLDHAGLFFNEPLARSRGALHLIVRRLFINVEGASRKARTKVVRSGYSETAYRNSNIFSLAELSRVLTLPWSHYVLLVRRSRSPEAMQFYHAEALRGGWSVRQLQRQIDSQFYERTALSRDKAKMLMAPQVTQRTAASASGPQDFLISSAEFGHSTGELRTSRTTRYRPRWQRPLRTRGWAKACRHCTAHENGRLLANRMRATSQPQ
jgi:hypothetical protein